MPFFTPFNVRPSDGFLLPVLHYRPCFSCEGKKYGTCSVPINVLICHWIDRVRSPNLLLLPHIHCLINTHNKGHNEKNQCQDIRPPCSPSSPSCHIQRLLSLYKALFMLGKKKGPSIAAKPLLLHTNHKQHTYMIIILFFTNIIIPCTSKWYFICTHV